MWGEVKTFVRSALFISKLVMICVMLMPGAVVVLMMPWARRARNLYSRLSCAGIRWLVHHINGVKLEIRGELKSDDRPCMIVVASHASLLDVPILLSLRPKIAVMAKEYIGHNLLYGMIARALGMFSVNESYEQAVSVVERKIEEGYSVAVFPEGRRTKDGEIQRFHKGAFYMAERLGLTIQPIFMYGSFHALNRHGLKLQRHPIYVEVMEPIEVDDERYGKDYRSRAKALEEVFRGKVLV